MSDNEISNPLQAGDTTTIDYAVSRLLKEPAQAATPDEEPEDTAEPSEDDYEPTDEPSPEGEDEVEEDEVEPEEEGEDEEGEEELYYTIKVDGEEIEVSLDELQSGYQRQKDYTKKTQALAEQRKAYEAKAAEVEQLQQQYLHQAQLANELLNRDLKKYESLNWEDMKVNDPVGYLQKQIEIGEIRQRQGTLQQQAQAAYEYNQKAQAEERQQYLEMQRKEAVTLFPDWKDSTKQEAHKLKLAEYGRSVGYTDDDLGNLIDAKDLVVLDKAMKYDEMHKTKQSLKSKSTTPAIRKRVKAKGVAPKGANQQRVIATKQDTLRKSGSLKDAASLMLEMRSRKVIRK